jgi:hypothetical protein
MAKNKKPQSEKAGGFSSFRNKCRSRFEERIGKELYTKGVPFEYERLKIKFEQPAKPRTYTPDFVLPNGIIIEAKGRLTVKTRQKHEYVQTQHPKLDIRFVFQRAKNPIYKGSKTTYADWAEKKGFKWAEKRIPNEWLKEPKKNITLSDKVVHKKK